MLLGVLPKGAENLDSHKNLHTDVYGSVIYTFVNDFTFYKIVTIIIIIMSSQDDPSLSTLLIQRRSNILAQGGETKGTGRLHPFGPLLPHLCNGGRVL